VTSSTTQTDCWARLATGGLGWWRYGGTGRPAAASLGGTPATTPNCLYAGGGLHCFATTTARRLAQITYRNGKWGKWADLGDKVQQRPACVSLNGARIDCLAMGTDAKLRWRAFDGRSWGKWSVVAKFLSVGAAPVCHARNGGLDCLVVAATGAVHQLRLGSDRKWSTARNLGGRARGTGSCLGAGTAGRACFFTGTDGHLRRIAFDGTRWGGWSDLGGSLVSSPSCVRLGDTTLCFAAGGDGTLQETRLTGTAWTSRQSLGGSLKPQRPACVAPSGARADCFVWGSDASLKHIAYE
jgi:hypothetical protein